MISEIGLAVIVIAWVIELFTLRKKKSVNPAFVGFYMLGVVILIYDGFASGLNSLAIANLASLAVSGAVLVKTLKK